jgi:methionyl aminopeptidase
MTDKNLVYAIKAAKIHKNISKYVCKNIKPEMSLINIVKIIENKIKEESSDKINNGIGFPVGVSLNNCAAHYTPNYCEKDIILKDQDIIKIDFGVHSNGVIIDSALTLHFDSKYDEFIQISKDLTDFAVKQAGPDAILGEIGEAIEEYIKGTEIYIDNKLCQLKTMEDLSGHLIKPYEIHAGKAVPNIKINYPLRMLENEYYAIEPFLTTGLGKSILKEPNSHYMLSKNHNMTKHLDNSDIRHVYDIINKNYSTLPFCQRWLYEFDKSYEYDKILKQMETTKILNSYPPIYDIEGSIISQFEHTIYIKKNGIINLTQNTFVSPS